MRVAYGLLSYKRRPSGGHHAAEELRQWFFAKGHEAQVLQQGEAFVVQGRKGGITANLFGLGVAVTIILDRTGTGFKASLGGSAWASRATVAAVGLALYGVPTLTAAYGAGKQKALELHLWRQIEQYVTARGGRRVSGG
jgi:hypothetical protein